MSGPDVEQTAEPAATESMLGEEALRAATAALREWVNIPYMVHAAEAMLSSVNPHVAALVAAAEERGFDRGVRAAGSGPALAAVRAEAEWRGAEKERGRAVADRAADAEALTSMQRMLKDAGERLAAVQAERDDLELRFEDCQETVTDLAAAKHVLDLARPCWCGATAVGSARPVDHDPGAAS